MKIHVYDCFLTVPACICHGEYFLTFNFEHLKVMSPEEGLEGLLILGMQI